MFDKDSINKIIEVVVADKNLDEITKRQILSYIESPTNLSSEISTISDILSSTNQFYQEIVSDFEKTGPNSQVEVILTKINARQNYYSARSMLYDYDSDLKESLDNTIKSILDEKNINYWKDRTTVTSLSQNYTQIIDLYNRGRYTEATPKIINAKSQVKKIIKEGIIEYTEETSYTYLIFVILGLFILIAIIFVFNKMKIKSSKKQKKKTHLNDDPEYLLNKRDPFR